MAYCVNPQCAKPQNSSDCKTCHSCGHNLRLNGKYGALKEISCGGFGRTFLAVDYSHPNKRRCVIKQLFPDTQNAQSYKKTLELFRQEARQLKRLSEHPQIPDCFDLFEENNQQFIIQEFVDGHNLNQQLTLNGLFTEAQLVKLLKDILPVLDFIHQKGVIHRDIKPANIIYSKDDTLWLVDLGAAKQLTGTALAKTGTVIGSAEYTAPEQVRGKATFASDIYSLGVTCIYLLTGVSPFNLYDTGDSRWVWRDFLPNAVSLALSKLLDKMIQMSTNKRYQAVQDIQADLANINLREKFNSKTDKNFSRIPVSDKQPSLLKEQDSYKDPKNQLELQQEDTQPEPLQVSAAKTGELIFSQTDKKLVRQSLPWPIRRTGAAFAFLSFSVLALLISSLRIRSHLQYRPSQESANNRTRTTLVEDSHYDFYLETSADWQIKTDLYTAHFFSTAISQNDSKIGFYSQYVDSEGPAFEIWDLEMLSSHEPNLTLLNDLRLKPVGAFVGNDIEKPLVVDQDNQLGILDILTSETSLIPEQQEFSLDTLGISDRDGFLTVNATKSIAHYIEFKDYNEPESTPSVKVWDIKTGELLVSKQKGYFWSLISHDTIWPFSPDGNWLLLSNGAAGAGVELWDLKIKEKVNTIQADAVTFSLNKNFIIVEEHNQNPEKPGKEIIQTRLFDLRTQEYVLQSFKVKHMAIHPQKETVAIFDGEKILISNVSDSSVRQTINLEEYLKPQNLRFSPDGSILAGRLGFDKNDVGHLIFWDVKAGKVLEEPQKIGGIDSVLSPTLQFSPDGKRLLIKTDIVGNAQNNLNEEIFIQIWDVPQPLQE